MKHFLLFGKFIYNSLALHLTLNDNDNEANNADYSGHFLVFGINVL